MTLPGARLPRLNAMAVGASNDALMPLDLSLNGCDGLELGDICSFPLHVVDIERCRVSLEPAIDTTSGQLELRDPSLNGTSASVLHGIDSFPVARLLQSTFAPSAPLIGGWFGPRRPSSTRAKGRTELGVLSFGKKIISTLRTRTSRGACSIPGRHMSILSSRGFANPCKPDIFAATYEEAN